ncbi:unnamed protein product [Cylicostephanus goldi]|uniref:Helicase ATP-binding domain-containing protein n=1 Tax=Cylicostephanus goldi TaxID=71465 RepID=A0A3P7NDK2_CYLGO|nr:unnamed protein product [Cylicostephanus goldi]
MITKRDDMKLILMSATINLDLFKGYFEGAPVVQVGQLLYLCFCGSFSKSVNHL